MPSTPLRALGGGRVDVPEGVWLTGPIVLKDNIELHVGQNAVIVFSDDKSLYPLVETTFEGLNTLRCQSPLSARGVRNVAVTGCGVIDQERRCVACREEGQKAQSPVSGRSWCRAAACSPTTERRGIPRKVTASGPPRAPIRTVSTWAATRADFERMRDFLRPVLVAIHNCENVLLEGVTFQNSPCWNIHPAMCTNLIVNDITVRCPDYAQNSDGIDIESCRNVVLTGSRFDVGDDGICIKSGKGQGGPRPGHSV